MYLLGIADLMATTHTDVTERLSAAIDVGVAQRHAEKQTNLSATGQASVDSSSPDNTQAKSLTSSAYSKQ
ncbi:unnamed protein product [Protopolystoma xenopodis]|uniref:Uncharacterized protein n=1 Tax=Protopolystoma xenopodis TaxID=117903 RepID=A0A3S5FDF2_9PLAT|nr:unnamed protein product [Protopolystoma xenopodis]